jgi:nitrate/nitrite transporter NarK
MFGSVFFLIQLFQDVYGMSPLSAGVHALPWTALPMLVAPVAGILSDRFGSRPFVAFGLLFQAVGLAWIAAVTAVSFDYAKVIPGLVLAGIGNGLFFAPIANLVLGSVRRDQEGIASGVNNAIREFGGVLGVAVMGAIFSSRGGYGPTAILSAQQHFINGVKPAVFTGAAVLLVASAMVWALPRHPRTVDAAAAA